MSFINYAAREINCKVVYYGPGLCGKTTNLQYIYERSSVELERVFEEMQEKSAKAAEGPAHPSPFAEITDEDIDSLFSE